MAGASALISVDASLQEKVKIQEQTLGVKCTVSSSQALGANRASETRMSCGDHLKKPWSHQPKRQESLIQ